MAESISKNWSRENIAWLAGVIEGEGCISVDPESTKSSRLIVAMTDEDVVRKVQEIAGCGTVHPRTHKNAQWKSYWIWSLHKAKHVLALSYAIYPFMGLRRQEKLRAVVERVKRMRLPLNGSPHGSRNRYLRGRCRCELCCAAAVSYLKEWSQR